MDSASRSDFLVHSQCKVFVVVSQAWRFAGKENVCYASIMCDIRGCELFMPSIICPCAPQTCSWPAHLLYLQSIRHAPGLAARVLLLFSIGRLLLCGLRLVFISLLF